MNLSLSIPGMIRTLFVVAILLRSPHMFAEARTIHHLGNPDHPTSWEVTLDPTGGFNSTAFISLPKWANVTNASFSISPELHSDYPVLVALDIGDDSSSEWIWVWLEGLGRFGRQYLFPDDQQTKKVFLSGSSSTEVTVRLPWGAKVTSASFKIDNQAEVTRTFDDPADFRDAQVSKYQPTTNFGDAQSASLYSVDDLNIVHYLYYLPPTPTGIAENAVIKGIFLSLRTGLVNSANCGAIDMMSIKAGWNENTLTWTNQPFNNSTLSVVNASDLIANAHNAWEITSEALKWLDGEPNFGVVLKARDDNSYCELVFYGRNATAPSWRPRLDVTYFNVTNDVTLDIGNDTYLESQTPVLTSVPLTISGQVIVDALNNQTQTLPPSIVDQWGNKFVEIPITINGSNEGGVRFSELSIEYNITSTVGFDDLGSGILADQLNQLISVGTADNYNNVTIPINITNWGPAKLRLDNFSIEVEATEISHSFLEFPASKLVPSGQAYTIVTEHLDPQGITESQTGQPYHPLFSG